MNRVRVSTTVDSEKLKQAEALVGAPRSALFDAALAALIEKRLDAQEIAALSANPYQRDSELFLPKSEIDWDVELPYDGEIPPNVVALAKRRRRAKAR